MFFGEIGDVAARLTVDDEIDVALPPQGDFLRAMLCYLDEAERFEQGFQHARFGGCKFNEFKAVQAHRVFIQICHVTLQVLCLFYNLFQRFEPCLEKSQVFRFVSHLQATYLVPPLVNPGNGFNDDVHMRLGVYPPR